MFYLFQTLAIKLIEGLLEELSKTNSLSVSLAGPIRDSATVALPTFLGGLAGGPLGAFIGNFQFGSVCIGIMCFFTHHLLLVIICRSCRRHRNPRFITRYGIWQLQTSDDSFKRGLYGGREEQFV
jgi:hypothetical protein